MMGRETGSKGDFQTADYVAAEFQRLGLTPAGEGGGWFQAVPFWIASPAGRSLSILNGPTLQLGVDYVLPAVTRSAPGAVLDVVYGGSANDPAHWIDAAQATGKVVVLDLRPDSAGKRDAPPLTPILRASAVLQCGRHRGGSAGRTVAGRDREPESLHPSPRHAPVSPACHRCWRSRRTPPTSFSARPVSSLQAGATGGKVQGEMTAVWNPTPYPARNVIGVLPGRDPRLRGEYVSVTGHNDHVGICMSAVDHDSMRAFLHVLRPMGADTRHLE